MVRLGLVDHAIEIDKSSRDSQRSVLQQLKQKSYDHVFCPHESWRSLRLTWAVRARRKTGFRRAFNGWILDDRVRRPLELPEALRQLALLSPASPDWSERLLDFSRRQTADGGQDESGELMRVPVWADMSVGLLSNASAQSPQTVISEISKLSENVAAILNELGRNELRPIQPIAFIAPGSVWKTKMWTADGYTRVAREMLALGYRVVIVGSPDEKPICDDIAFRAPGAISLAGRTSLFDLAILLAFGKILFCNDSGSMHLAAAAGLPTVSMFGPTILEFGYRPWQNQARVVEVPRAELKCRPCGMHGSDRCPIGTHECMRKISPEQVLAAAAKYCQSVCQNMSL